MQGFGIILVRYQSIQRCGPSFNLCWDEPAGLPGKACRHPGFTHVSRLGVQSCSHISIASLSSKIVAPSAMPTTAAPMLLRGTDLRGTKLPGIGHKVTVRLPHQQGMSHIKTPGSSLPTGLAHQEAVLGQTATVDPPPGVTHTQSAILASLLLLKVQHGQALQRLGSTASRLPCKALPRTGQTAISGTAHLEIPTEWILQTEMWQLETMVNLQPACPTVTGQSCRSISTSCRDPLQSAIPAKG